MPGRSAIVGVVGRSKQSRQARGASCRSIAYIHVQCTCTKPPSCLLPLPPPRSMCTFQRPIRKMCAWFHAWPRDDSSAPRAETRLTFFRDAGNLPIFISGTNVAQRTRPRTIKNLPLQGILKRLSQL